jgi:hypothetical protein
MAEFWPLVFPPSVGLGVSDASVSQTPGDLDLVGMFEGGTAAFTRLFCFADADLCLRWLLEYLDITTNISSMPQLRKL